MSDELSLNPNWRARVREIGKMNFVREEMLRLGFFTEIDEKERQRLITYLDDALPRLSKLKKELEQVLTEIADLDDAQDILKEVRSARIARVRQEREVRKAKKEGDKLEQQRAWREKKSSKPPFLGVGVSNRLLFEGGAQTRLVKLGLPLAKDANELAAHLNISTGELHWLCYERAAATIDHYNRFEIPKKSGGSRLISSPKPKLRHAQRWVLDEVLASLEPSSAATAFRAGTSIVKNAEPHIGAQIFVRFDFKDFFPSITFPRVRGFFESLGYNPGVATLLALISTDAPRARVALDGTSAFVAIGERSLPQGACSSPALANLITRKLDARLLGLCRASDDQWCFTRYADDLTFSSKNESADVGRLMGSVLGISNSEGFLINEQKTKVMRAPSRRIVTGLTVDERVKLSRRDLRNLRAFLHRCERDGFSQVSSEIGKDALYVARGKVAYVQMVMPDCAKRLREKHAWL